MEAEPEDAGLFVISVAAELAGMHPQTLRQYDRLGLVTPSRAKGRGRRYSHSDVERLREIQRLSQEEGINLAGIQRIIAMSDEISRLRGQVEELQRGLERRQQHISRVFAADRTGAISAKTPHAPRPRAMVSRGSVWEAMPTSVLQWLANHVDQDNVAM